MVENGKRRIDRYSPIVDLADALSVPVAELAPELKHALVSRYQGGPTNYDLTRSSRHEPAA